MGDLSEFSKPQELQLNNHSRGFLNEIAKWTNFLSIMGFIGVGLMVVLAFSMGAIFSAIPNQEQIPFAGGAFFTIFYLLFALLYFFPIYYLYKFSANLKLSLKSKNDDELTSALEYLKSHYKFIGILTIVMLSIYALIFLFGIIGAAAASSF